MSDTVQLAWVALADHVAVAIIAAIGILGAAKITANMNKKVLEKVAEVHTLTNSNNTEHLAQIAKLTEQVALLTNAASFKAGERAAESTSK